MTEIAELKGKRGRLKGSLTKLKTFVENIPPERKTIEEIQLRIEFLEKLFSEFTVVDDKLVGLEVVSEFSDFEDKYLSVKPLLLKTLNALKANQVAQSTAVDDLNSTMIKFFDQQRNLVDNVTNLSSTHDKTLEVRLPKIQIPPFSGDYKDWPSFKDLFLSSVDNREGLSNSQKLQYLKGFLQGEAASLIKHIFVTEANYKEAWSKLSSRYDKRRHILNSYIKAFINQPTVHQPSAILLRKLTDTTDELIRGITALGEEANGRDPWLIYIVLNKTDDETRKAWAEEISDNNIPSLQHFLDFLTKRCDALETIEPTTRKANPIKSTIRNFHTNTSGKCPECMQDHPLFKCAKFKAMDVQTRRKLIPKYALCFNCLSPGHQANKCKSKVSCHFCKQQHHSSLHMTDPIKGNHQVTAHVLHAVDHIQSHSSSTFNPDTPAFTQLQPSKSFSKAPATTINPEIHSLTSMRSHHNGLSLLPTALVHIQDITGKFQPCRMLIDSGSQASFVSEDCVQRLGLKREGAKIMVHGLGSVKTCHTRGKVTLTISSRLDRSVQIQVQTYILSRLTSHQPAVEFNIKDWNYLTRYTLADPTFYKPSKIDILLGADYFIPILKQGQHISSCDHPALQNTIFGYIVAGSLKKGTESTSVSSLHADIGDIDKTLRQFWETEEIHQQGCSYTLEEEMCESHFNATHYVDTSGRYTVRLPFKDDSPRLGNSLDMAISRFTALERRFKNNPDLHEEYCEFIREYKNLGHLESIPPNTLETKVEHIYLPHHAVLKPDSKTTKLRVVFDGSALTSTGTSLNQNLMVGPKIQRDLFEILVSFRTFRIAVTADIAKMYRMIQVDNEDRNYQRILWREHPTQPIQHLWLNTVTYGTSSAPFLATRCLKQLTIDFKEQFPLAEEAIRNNFYVDDLMAGADDINHAIQLKNELQTLLQLRGFHLRKWASNSQDFLEILPPELRCIASLRIDENPDSIKVLGLKWIPAEDVFTFDVNYSSTTPVTKRSILSESSRVFDPLGLLAPITVLFKLLLQRIWLENYTWDEPISGDLEKRWNEIRNNLHHIQTLRIPRWMSMKSENFELHGFSDASEAAYAAVVYCRSTYNLGEIITTLFVAKTKIAPIKQVSIPRLELCGALLVSQLLNSIKTALGKPDIDCFGWTDSTAVLSWLSSHPRKWKSYIGNRTSEILSTLPRSCWNYVRSKENPADIASRGVLPQNLEKAHLWWHGPKWLQDDWKTTTTAMPSSVCKDADLEKRATFISSYQTTISNDTLTDLFQKKSSLRSILRVVGRCIRFYNNCKHSMTTTSTPWITTDELNAAEKICIRWTQESSFQEELQALQRRKPVPKSSKLLALTPFLDEDNILRVGGRLENAECSYSTKHPVILPKDHIFVLLLIRYTHEKYLHAETSLLISILRQRFWIISCRSLVKRHIHHCTTCVRQRAKISQQLMANLPSRRVSFTKPFENVGVDYAGPIALLLHRGRGARSTKGYIALFVCFTTKALHLEVVSDLSAEAFISCLKRFTARRGMPSNIYSDNATNFVGANRKLCELYQLVMSKTYNALIADFLSNQSISWHFNPPAAPHFGGIWEAGVKSVKALLKKTIGDSRLTFEELATLITEVEGLLNSRPLVPISDDISSLDVLTPAHFLIGKPITSLPEPTLEDVKMSSLTRWRLLQHMVQDFWKRWHAEYLTTLQHRPKWTKTEDNLAVNDLVLIREGNLPPSAWILGRILETHPGQDKLVRVATLRTSKGQIKRPLSKLVKLPIVKALP